MNELLRGLAAVLVAVVSLAASQRGGAQQIGEVSTVFRFLGKNDRIVVEGYDDPKVKGVTCYVSRARTGGIKGSVGLAEDKSEASIACRQVADVVAFTGKLPSQEDVFTERLSLLFKRLHVVRVVDPVRNVLIYMTYSDRFIEGSPQNSVTAVPIPRSNPIPVK
ncbi:MAG: CreA family protein [Burkholderiaceae bacterium]